MRKVARCALYTMSQIAIFLAVTAVLRLTLFPDTTPKDWALTLGYGSLFISPLILARKRPNWLLCLVAAFGAWAVGHFGGLPIDAAIVVYLCLWGVCLFHEQYVMGWISFAIGMYGALMLQMFQGAPLGDEFKLVWNLLFTALLIVPTFKAVDGIYHDEKTQTDSNHEREDWKKAA